MDERIKALTKQGTAYVEQGQYQPAIAVYTEMLQLCEELQKANPEDTELKRAWCLACNGLGQSYFEAGDRVAAREWHTKALPVSEQLAEAPGAVLAKRELSKFYGDMGDSYAAEGDLAAARVWYEKKWEAARRFSEQVEAEVLQYDYAIACCKMGLVSRGEERLGWYQQAQEVLVRLTAQNPDNRVYSWMKDSCEKTIQMLQNAE